MLSDRGPSGGKRIACIGECMIEARMDPADKDRATMAFGGDTLNTAVYLARRLADTDIACAYVTWLGDDERSSAMVDAWASEGIAVDHVRRIPGRATGLYMISVDELGERRFQYWRSAAPVREMFSGDVGREFSKALLDYDGIYFSGITLAILQPEGRERLLDAAAAIRARGGVVAVDTNHRPLLWSRSEAARELARAMRVATLLLPSAEDLGAVFEASDDDWAGVFGDDDAQEIVLRRGATRVQVFSSGGRRDFSLSSAARVVDTTAAGDSFNAGYLAARLKGRSVDAAVESAHALATAVIAHPGAIIAQAEMPSVEDL